MAALTEGAAAPKSNESTAPLLRVAEVSKAYDGVRALSSVSLEVGRGEVLALAGENGSGKSTLIKIIAGVESPDSGEIFIDRADWTARSPVERIEAGLQVIYQDFALFPNLSAAENIWLPQQLHRGRHVPDRAGGMRAARRILDEIGVTIDLRRPVSDLSVAQKQLIAIARALAHDARLLVMDEPTTALTHREVEHLFTIVRRLVATGMSFIFVSHKLQEVAEICERVVVLRNGGKALEARLVDVSEAALTLAMTGRDLAADTRPAVTPAPNAPTLLAVEQLTRDRDYRNVSFELAAGEILGLAGLMGAGRTALAKGLFGLVPADSGRIVLNGKPIAIRNVGNAARAKIAYVPEDRLSEGLFLDFSIEDNVVVRSLDRLMSKGGWITQARKRREAERWIERLAIKTPSSALSVRSLSGGNQQRVVLAKWMASQPTILILNRPTVGVDVASKADIHEIIRELSSKDIGIIVISDELPELMRLCHRILVMRNGSVIAERRTEHSSADEIMQIVSENSP
jgi:simple sugar transport system ATP-binding protein